LAKGDGFTILDLLSYDPYIEREMLKSLAKAYGNLDGHYPEVIGRIRFIKQGKIMHSDSGMRFDRVVLPRDGQRAIPS